MGLARRKPRVADAFSLPATQEEFEAWCLGPGGPVEGHYEFLFGCVVAEPAAGWPHGAIAASTVTRLGEFVRCHDLGLFFDSSQGFAMPSGDTLEPDASVVLRATWDAGPPPRKGRFLCVVPDLVVEVLSARTKRRDCGPKREIYERNGVKEYWLVDAERVTITVLVRGPAGRLAEAQTACGDEPARSQVLPGFTVSPTALVPAEAR